VSSPVAPAVRLPFVVVLLTLGTFLMCTSEYLVAGLLPQLSSGLRARVRPAAQAAAGSRPHTAVRGEVLPERQLNDYRN
jgi:hypothetical protein